MKTIKICEGKCFGWECHLFGGEVLFFKQEGCGWSKGKITWDYKHREWILEEIQDRDDGGA